MNALDCGSTGAFAMSWFHQLSSGNSLRPLKSSVSCTPADGEPPPSPAGFEGAAGVPPQPMATVRAITIPACELRIRFVILCSRAVGGRSGPNGIKSHSPVAQERRRDTRVMQDSKQQVDGGDLRVPETIR